MLNTKDDSIDEINSIAEGICDQFTNSKEEPSSNLNVKKKYKEYNLYEFPPSCPEIYSSDTYSSEIEYQQQYAKGNITQSDLNKVFAEMYVDGSTWQFGFSKRKFFRSLLLSTPPPLNLYSLNWRLIENNQLSNFNSNISFAKKNRLLTQDKTNLSFDLLDKASIYSTPPKESWLVPWPTATLKSLGHNDFDAIRNKWNDSHSLALLWTYCCHLAYKTGELLYPDKPNTDSCDPNSIENPISVDELVRPFLVKFASAYLDSFLPIFKISPVPTSLLSAFFSNLDKGQTLKAPWLSAELLNLNKESNVKIILRVLTAQNIDKSVWKPYLEGLSEILLGELPHLYPSDLPILGSKQFILDFLAIHLMVEDNVKHFLSEGADIKKYEQPLNTQVRTNYSKLPFDQTLAYQLFCAFQIFGIPASELILQNADSEEKFQNAILNFSTNCRLRVWQTAYKFNRFSTTSSLNIDEFLDQDVGGFITSETWNSKNHFASLFGVLQKFMINFAATINSKLFLLNRLENYIEKISLKVENFECRWLEKFK